MAFNLSDFFFGAGRGASQRALQQGEQHAYVDPFQYQGEQGALIQALMQSMSGQNSLAEKQFRGAMQDNMSNQVAMSRGRGAGAARNASQQLGESGTALAAGGAMAGLQERMAGAQQLQGALMGAHQIDFQRAMANQQMYQQALQHMMNQGGIGQSLMGLAGQGLGAYAMLRGPRQPQGQGQGQGLGQAVSGLGQSIGQGITGMFGSPGPADPWA